MAMSSLTGTRRLLLHPEFRGAGGEVQSIPAWFLVPREAKASGATVGAPAPCPAQFVTAAVVLVPAAMMGQGIWVPRMFPFASVRLATSRIRLALIAAQ